MKARARSVAWLLPLLLLTACFHFHKSHQPQNQALAPPIAKSPPPAVVEPPPVMIPTEATASDTAIPAKPSGKVAKHPVRHKKPANKEVQEASTENPGVSAIGQLSSGGPSDLRQQTDASITSTERGLNEITRQLSDQEQKTVAQIREFLKQARAALASGDVDGAHTLALKAKVLLGELNR